MSIYLETAKKQIEKGTVGLDAIKSNLTRHIEAENKAKWLADKQVEYDTLFKTVEIFKDIVNEDETISTVSDGFTYVEDCISFEEWINETRVVSEAIEATYDEDGVELTPYVPEVTELVRPYAPIEVTKEMIQAELDKLGYVSKEKQDALKYLADTDWYYSRYVDNGTAIPQEVMDKRAEARLIV